MVIRCNIRGNMAALRIEQVLHVTGHPNRELHIMNLLGPALCVLLQRPQRNQGLPCTKSLSCLRLRHCIL